MKTETYRAKKISKGHYLYRGFEIICVGYYSPEKRVCWEAVDERGCAFAHGFSLKECKMWIDIEYEKEKEN